VTDRVDAYAAALFEVAKAEGSLETVEEELFRVARTLEANDELRTTLSDQAIPIERRTGDEVACLGGRRLVPPGAAVDNRAFDVTPARLVTAVVTEAGVARPPYGRGLARLVAVAGHHSR